MISTNNHSNFESDNISKIQILKLLILGIIFWFTAAMMIRFGSPLGLFKVTIMPIQFLLAFPVTLIFFLISKKIVGFSSKKSLQSISIMTTMAILLDVIHLTWFTEFYGGNLRDVFSGTIWILWGVGVGLALGLYFEIRK